MTPDEMNYYGERTEIERQRAAEASNPYVIKIHEELAALYERLVSLGEGPTLQIAEDAPHPSELRQDR